MPSAFQQFVRESPYSPMAFGLLFVGFWVSINFLVSRLGWHAFAARYPARNRPAGQAYGSLFTHFGLLRSHYSCAVKIILSDKGVYFLPSLLTRAFHHPFLVPWVSVKRVAKKDGLLWSRYLLDVEDPAGEIHVTLPLKAEHELLKYQKSA
jgi:hypothetical protein